MKTKNRRDRGFAVVRSEPTPLVLPRPVKAWPDMAVLSFIAILSSVLLLWGLSEKYLWQDEAQTAVLATRLLRFGRPLAYDGTNLISLDQFTPDEAASVMKRSGSAKEMIDYRLARKEFKADLTWKWAPWGQYAIAALGIKLLGQTTLAARLPFALLGILTLLLLFRLVIVYCNSRTIAVLSSVLLVFNTYWILHSRQSRYYAPSSCFLVLTLLTYLRWQTGKKWGATAFVVTSWCWFQVDYGTVWPVLLVLFLDAFVAQRRSLGRPLLVGLALALTIAPFFYYYELWGRVGIQFGNWSSRFQSTLFNMNEFVVPVVMVIGAAALVAKRWDTTPCIERRLVAITCGIMVAVAIWIPSVAPLGFLRYSIMAAPVGCILCAWTLVRAWHGGTIKTSCIGAAVLVLTPWLSMPMHALIPPPSGYRRGSVFRSELSTLGTEVFGHQPDPNRIVIDWLKKNAAPIDEILINYEDIPLMYYLPNPIRGGISAFRVEDDAKTSPSFLILRSVGFVHWPVFVREYERYHWLRVPIHAPDVPWGNNPDPDSIQRYDPNTARDMIILRRVKETAQ